MRLTSETKLFTLKLTQRTVYSITPFLVGSVCGLLGAGTLCFAERIPSEVSASAEGLVHWPLEQIAFTAPETAIVLGASHAELPQLSASPEGSTARAQLAVIPALETLLTQDALRSWAKTADAFSFAATFPQPSLISSDRVLSTGPAIWLNPADRDSDTGNAVVAQARGLPSDLPGNQSRLPVAMLGGAAAILAMLCMRSPSVQLRLGRSSRAERANSGACRP